MIRQLRRIITLVFLAGVFFELPALAASIEEIRERGYLEVAVPNVERPPYFYTKQGELMGRDIALVRKLAERLSVDVKFIRSAPAFDQTISLVSSGRADLAIGKISITLNRALNVSFSVPYERIRRVLLVNRLKFHGKRIGKDLTPKKLAISIGAVQGSSYAEFIRTDFPKAKPYHFDTVQKLTAAVKQGLIPAGYLDEVEARRALESSSDAALYMKVHSTDKKFDFIGIALPKDAHHLRNFVDIFLREVSKNGN